MRLTIERLGKNDVKFVIESHVIKDVTGNDWLLEVTNNKIYITYEGRIGDRFSSLRVMSKDGQEFKATHENIFASRNNSFESYYWLRSIVKNNETLGVWSSIQNGILENPLTVYMAT